MKEDMQKIIKEAEQEMGKVVNSFKSNIEKIQVHNPSSIVYMIENLTVKLSAGTTLLKHAAYINKKDEKSIGICLIQNRTKTDDKDDKKQKKQKQNKKPHVQNTKKTHKQDLEAISKAVYQLPDLEPMINDQEIHLDIPPMTLERRKKYQAKVNELAELFKSTIGNIRKKYQKMINDKDISKKEKQKYCEELNELNSSYRKKIDDSKENKIESILKA